MRILITGGAGFIGSNLVRHMVNEGHEVLNFDKLTYAGNLGSLTDIESKPNYQFLHGDLCKPTDIANATQQFQPDWIMHLAAESHVDRSIDGPGEFIQTNVVGTFNLLQSSRQYYDCLKGEARTRFRFLHVSTDEVYGTLGPTGQFSEESPYDPNSPYSASKAASDHLARAWHATYGLPVIVTNCSNNYGPYQFPEKLVPVVIIRAMRGEPIPVYGKGENIRDWLYVGDHCDALYAVIRRGRAGQTYAIGGNNELRNIDLANLICDILDNVYSVSCNTALRTCLRKFSQYRELIAFVADRPAHDFRYSINAQKVKTEVAWQPKECISTGFEKTVRWYIDNEAWWNSLIKRS